jgi:hypothetical protein
MGKPQLATHPLHHIAPLLQRRHQHQHMVALHFNHAVFHRAARSAGGFELLGHSAATSNAKPRTSLTLLTPRTLGCELHPQHPVRHLRRCSRSQPVSRTTALRHRLTAIGADAAGFGGIKQGGGSVAYHRIKTNY